MTKWIARHRGASRVIALVIYAALLLSLYYLTDIIWLSILLSISFLFVLLTLISNAPIQALAASEATVNNECDPYPFLEEVSEALRYKLAPQAKQVMLINKAVASVWIGRRDEYCEMIRSINIDALVGTPPAVKYVYYLNLCNAYMLEGNYAAADAYYDKTAQLYSALKPKQKDALLFSYRFAECEHIYRQKQTALARELSEVLFVCAPNNKSKVELALFIAKLRIELGDEGAARERLQFVIDNGNRLYAVTEAKELLESLSVK